MIFLKANIYIGVTLLKVKMNEKYKIRIEVNAFKCLRCSHRWIPRVSMEELEGQIKEKPRICPDCKSAYWDLEPKKKKNSKK